MATIDSYSESNQSDSLAMNNGGSHGKGQALTLSRDAQLTSAEFYLKKGNSPTGNATFGLYVATGTVGTDAYPTGSILASNTYDVSNLTADWQLIEVTFSSPYDAITGDYCVTIEYSGGDGSNVVYAGGDSSSPSHSGNYCSKDSSSVWSGSSISDVCFYLYGTQTPAVTTILDEVGNRLTSNITGANGYNYTIKKIERGRLEPFTGYDLPAINYWCITLASERSVYGGDSRDLTLFVEIHEMTRDEPFVDVVSKLAADVVTALNRTTAAPKVSDAVDHNLGGTVTEFIFNNCDYEIGTGQKPWCGALLSFTIRYQTDPFDMFSYEA